MDTGLSIRPVQPVSVAPVRVAPPAERQTVATELPASNVVTAAAEDPAVAARPDDEKNALRGQIEEAFQRRAQIAAAQVAGGRLAGETVSKVIQDETTKELVFRKVSATTGEVIGQFPEEAMLRLKAYNAQQAKRVEAESSRIA